MAKFTVDYLKALIDDGEIDEKVMSFTEGKNENFEDGFYEALEFLKDQMEYLDNEDDEENKKDLLFEIYTVAGSMLIMLD